MADLIQGVSAAMLVAIAYVAFYPSLEYMLGWFWIKVARAEEERRDEQRKD